jgi:hypothetical protein
LGWAEPVVHVKIVNIHCSTITEDLNQYELLPIKMPTNMKREITLIS